MIAAGDTNGAERTSARFIRTLSCTENVNRGTRACVLGGLLHNLRSSAGLAVLLVLSGIAGAADRGPEQVVVTATRLAEPLDQTLSSVTVITRADIQAKQYLTLDEALATVPGVSLSNNGGIGKGTFFFIRGAEADQNLVLVNGVRVGSTTLGTTAIQDIPLEQIERIEVVRGPRSSLYGADALGGVVQIFTRSGSTAASPGLRPEVSVGTGSNGTHRASANLGSRGDRGFWQLGASLLESDGTNACQGFGFPLFVGCFTDEPDADAYRNRAGSFRGGLTLGEATQLEAFAMLTSGRVEYDGSFGNVADFSQHNVGVSVVQPLGARSTLRAQAGRATDDTENFDGTVSMGRFDTTRDSASLLLDTTLSERTVLTVGLDHLRDKVDSSTSYVERDRTATGVFVQSQWTFGVQELQASVRHDDNEQFGGKTTGAVSWGLALSPALRLTLSGGTGFKAPSFNELYFPGFGNPDLGPETSVSVESSLRWREGAHRATLTVYQNRIDDLIGIDSNFNPVNIDRTRIRGAELELGTQYLGWDLAGSAEWLDPQNLSDGANYGKVLPRRARNLLRADVSREFGPLRLGTRLHYAGARFDNLSNTRRLGGYATVDLLAEWRVQPEWRLLARAENLFDRDYATAAFFPQAGREFHVTLRWVPAP